jgi:hypothetical protein
MSKQKWLAVPSLFLVLACSGSKLSRKPASAGPGPGQDLVDLEVSPGQEVFWGGSPEAEEDIFKGMGQQIREIIKRQTQDLRKQPYQRGFHAKSQGCLRGTLVLDPLRPPSTREGIFDSTRKSWRFWSRFSNGAGWHDSDTATDVRGLALKVLGVPGVKLLDDEKTSQDFIMISSPVGFGKDSDTFMRFAEVNSKTTGLARQADLGGFAIENPSAAHAITSGLISTELGISSLAKIQYYSGTPYKLGTSVMKYSVKPETCSPRLLPGSGETDESEGASSALDKPGDKQSDKLSEDLVARGKTGFCMGLYVQLQSSDPKKTPIEDASHEWKEKDAAFLRVATLLFSPGQDPSDPAVKQMCDQLSFNPWHSIAEHRPLGNQNRARRWVYDSSRAMRAGGNARSPVKGWEIE